MPLSEVTPQIRLNPAEESAQDRQKKLDSGVLAIARARADLEEKLAEWQKRCAALQQDMRKASLDAGALRYRTFATLQLRLAGAVNQALKRAEEGDRLVQIAKAEQEEAARRESEDKVREAERQARAHVARSLLPTSNDFESLYGDIDEGEGAL